jgi:SPP1 gp7 family putative phage head morphogenesis protein
VEARTLRKLKRAYLKAIRNIQKFGSPHNEFIDEIIYVLQLGMEQSYIFGLISSRTSGNLKKEFADEFMEPTKVLAGIWEQDKDLLKLYFKKQTIDKNMFTSMFRPHQQAIQFIEEYTVELANVQGQAILDEVQKISKKIVEDGAVKVVGKAGVPSTVYTEEKALKKILPTFSNSRIHAIARTETTRAYSLGNIADSYTEPDIVGYKFVAVMDGLTSLMCQERDGMMIDKNDLELLTDNTPPLHVNCRSTLFPVFNFQADKLKNISRENFSHTNVRDADKKQYIQFIQRLR